jgi:hypothetical protein
MSRLNDLRGKDSREIVMTPPDEIPKTRYWGSIKNSSLSDRLKSFSPRSGSVASCLLYFAPSYFGPSVNRLGVSTQAEDEKNLTHVTSPCRRDTSGPCDW